MNVYIMIGYSGSGKTTIANKIVKQARRKTVMLSADTYTKRFHADGMTYRENIAATEKAIVMDTLRQCRLGNDVVLDGCYNNKELRHRIMSIIYTLGHRNNVDIRFISMNVKTSFEVSSKRIRERNGFFADEPTELKNYDIDWPTLEEGFYTIISVDNGE